MMKNTENYPTIPTIRRRIAECVEVLKTAKAEGDQDTIAITTEEIQVLRDQLHDLSGI